jgi:hypothetical protein
MELVRAEKAKQEFEELLAAAEQLARLRATPHSSDTEAGGGASGKAEVRLIRHGAQSGEGEDGHD